MIIRAALWLIYHLSYPNKNGSPVWRDPTYGRIDRDIQWRVQNEIKPSSIGPRVAWENTMQNRRDSEKRFNRP